MAAYSNRNRTAQATSSGAGKGSPLTEEEVVGIRNGSTAVAMPRDVVAKVSAARGYDDINPERCWEEWQRVRAQLHRSPIGLDESQK